MSVYAAFHNPVNPGIEMKEVIFVKLIRSFAPFYLAVILVTFLIVQWGNRTVTVMSESAPLTDRHCVIIDAGHGGVDGGATSCTGVLESQINLEIAIRLNDLLHLLGHDTKMIRTTDISVYTEGQTIAAKKVSDLKQRVKVINETTNALVLSIHQNYFTDSRYAGAQVFYADTENSKILANSMQSGFSVLGSTRNAKPCSGVYLMEHIRCDGVLVECGFISNHAEEAKIRTSAYQKQLCCVIAATVNTFLNT
jgi:N-acetylmuramoyl-L-alanine amidase